MRTTLVIAAALSLAVATPVSGGPDPAVVDRLSRLRIPAITEWVMLQRELDAANQSNDADTAAQARRTIVNKMDALIETRKTYDTRIQRSAGSEELLWERISFIVGTFGEEGDFLDDSLELLGEFYSDQGRYEDSVPFYQRLIELRSRRSTWDMLAGAHSRLSELYSELGSDDLAHKEDDIADAIKRKGLAGQ